MKNDYKKIEDEIDKIILAEIHNRLDETYSKLDFREITRLLEKKNREIVEFHQQGKILANLPALFSGYLQIKKGGRLEPDEKKINNTEYEEYSAKKSRLEVLFSASLNALQDDNLKHIVNEKNKLFDDMYSKTVTAVKLAETAENIKAVSDDKQLIIPRDESEAVLYLKEIVPLKAQLKEIEADYIQLKEQNCFKDALEHLQTSVNLAEKSITEKSRKALKFLFNQASSVFHAYKAVKCEISNTNIFIAQKEELSRYYALFDSIGDENRKKQTGSFISNIENTLGKLQKEIEKQKQKEAFISEQATRKVNEAYKQFLDIKDDYEKGKLDSEHKINKAVSKLKKCCNLLRANGHRVKASDIERFLNSTGLIKEQDYEIIIKKYIFYRKAFFGLLPVTLGLLIIVFYYIFYK